MIRESLLYLSESAAANKLVTGTPVARRLAERFVAGETMEDAVRVARASNEQGLSVSLDYLGEAVATTEEAEQAADVAVRTLEALAAKGVDGNISLKPSQLGFDLDETLFMSNIERILTRARELGDGEGEIFVRIDMEGSDYTERTVALVETLWAAGHRNMGTVLQSYLHRTPDDVERMIALGARVRLVKGAYMEPPTVAYPDKADVDRMFVEEMQMLLSRGTYPAIATHDEAMINATRRYAFEQGISKESFEFQMLYGIRRDLQVRLREEGYRVRVHVPFGESWYPYLMRRMAERPANVLFVGGNILRESPVSRIAKPKALGAGILAGALATLAWRGRKNGR
jgi:proline dehydrogenase